MTGIEAQGWKQDERWFTENAQWSGAMTMWIFLQWATDRPKTEQGFVILNKGLIYILKFAADSKVT